VRRETGGPPLSIGCLLFIHTRRSSLVREISWYRYAFDCHNGCRGSMHHRSGGEGSAARDFDRLSCCLQENTPLGRRRS
jgi:hypothetical protein